jgi:hypothetical protein
MTIENLPRPWVLAALTGLRMAELVAPPRQKRSDGQQARSSPQTEARRRRRRKPGNERRAPVVGERGLN